MNSIIHLFINSFPHSFFHPQVIEETLSPTWDQMLVLHDILLFGVVEDIKANPPELTVEIFDSDRVVSDRLVIDYD